MKPFHAGFLDGRDIRRCRRPLETGQAERLDLAPLCQRQRRQHGVGEQMNLSAHEVGQRRRGPLVRHHERVEAGVALQELDGEVAGRADAGGPERVFLRVLANEREEILEVVGRHARRGADDQRPVSDQRHRREIVHHVIGDALVQERIDHVHRGRHHQRVAVGSSLRDGIGADRSGRPAGSILDDEMLSDGFVELLHQDTCDAIDRSAGREWHDHGDRARRIGLSRNGCRDQPGEADREGGHCQKSHGEDPFEPLFSRSPDSFPHRSAGFGR